jgi:hypothetical protein
MQNVSMFFIVSERFKHWRLPLCVTCLSGYGSVDGYLLRTVPVRDIMIDSRDAGRSCGEKMNVKAAPTRKCQHVEKKTDWIG